MQLKAIKYLSPLTMYILAIVSFMSYGWLTYVALAYAFLLIPFVEIFIKPNTKNLSAAEEELAKADSMYDYILYSIVFFQFAALYFFLHSMKVDVLSTSEIVGRVLTMGLLCGTFGINVAHELGHRVKKLDQFFAKSLLLTSLYMHFFIEHNKGHHKNVSTPQDPSSARYNELIYVFFFRTIIFSYLSAWHIANDEMRKKNLPILHWKNEMLQAQFIQLGLIAAVYFFFGGLVTLYFLAAAAIGFLLLETINYIEHYGLQRKLKENGSYERAMPAHSWNSSHVLGRLMLFELSRHSDHHYMASRKYQILKHYEEAPQLPTGYPGSMILALIPPLWFAVMNRKIKKMQLLAQ